MKILYVIVMICMLFTMDSMSFAKSKTHQKKNKVITKPYSFAKTPLYGSLALSADLNNAIYAEGSRNNNVDIAVYVKSMRYGDSLYLRNINQRLTPASTLKIFTAEAALIYLGPNYRFSTQILTDAKEIKGGVLQGNLYVVLTGDPTLTYDDLTDLADNLKMQQIQAISGNVYIDNTAYDQRFYGPGWEGKDKQYCYGAPISASIINRNCLSFKMTPSQVGRATRVVTSPQYFYPGIRNTVVTSMPKRACSVKLSTDPGSVISIEGCMPKNQQAWGLSYVVTDIPEYNRSLFKNLLSQASIRVYGRVTFGSAPDRLAYLASHQSEPLRTLVNEMLKKSDNVIAGALFKKLGQLYTGRQGSWESGSFAVTNILSKEAGVNVNGLRILDGSGLSPDNLTTPQQIMQVLDFAYHHYQTSYDFISALPIAGVDGTLKHRLTHVARRVRAKTGTISGVVTLAGYAVAWNKEPLAFVIMVNGPTGMRWRYKLLEDKIVTSLTRYVRTENQA